MGFELHLNKAVIQKNSQGILVELNYLECFCQGGPWGHQESHFLPKNDEVKECLMGISIKAKSVSS